MTRIAAVLAACLALAACGGGDEPSPPTPAISPPAAPAIAAPAPTALGSPVAATAKPTATKPPATKPAARNPAPGNGSTGSAAAENVSDPDHVIGTGTPASCTSAAVVKAVSAGGVITFDCGPAPVTIRMTATAKVRNASRRVVLDGGGRVTLSGGGSRRILYQNTCDQALGWATDHCNDQDFPRLTLQNIALTGGNSTGDTAEGGGGGAVFVRGGRLKIVGARFGDNRCDRTGPDLGGAAVRVLDQGGDQPVQVVGSTFERGSCSNGGALSSIGVSWTITGSVFRDNEAIGTGANPARGGTPGGGSGGALYADGNSFTIRVSGSRIEDNHAREGGGAIFFVSNDRTGSLTIASSTLRRNPSDGFENSPGIFFLGKTLSR